MNNKIKVLSILLLAGFSFFYTDKVTSIIKENDPIMKQIKDIEKDMIVSKTDRIITNDEYITGINGCVVDEKESYNNMKNSGEFKQDLVVMKEDNLKEKEKLYIIGGNKKKRNVSVVLLNIDKKVDKYIKTNKIKVNYFLDGKYIKDNIDEIIKISKYSNIYNFGRDREYSDKYIVYDNTVILNNFTNRSDYCLTSNKSDATLDLCSTYNMDTIKKDFISDNIVTYTKENLENGQIFVFDKYDYKELEIVFKYILSKGYNIVMLNELLSERVNCNKF
jgi:hypothetical protein